MGVAVATKFSVLRSTGTSCRSIVCHRLDISAFCSSVGRIGLSVSIVVGADFRLSLLSFNSVGAVGFWFLFCLVAAIVIIAATLLTIATVALSGSAVTLVAAATVASLLRCAVVATVASLLRCAVATVASLLRCAVATVASLLRCAVATSLLRCAVAAVASLLRCAVATSLLRCAIVTIRLLGSRVGFLRGLVRLSVTILALGFSGSSEEEGSEASNKFHLFLFLLEKCFLRC